MERFLSLRDALTGTWVLTRGYRGIDGYFEGTASFVPDGDDLIYRETGTLTMGGAASEAFQAHRYRFQRTMLAVEFADSPRDGQVYLTLSLPAIGLASGVELAGTHVCPPDLYEVRYRFGMPGGFTVETTVTGPKKSYKAIATYRRA